MVLRPYARVGRIDGVVRILLRIVTSGDIDARGVRDDRERVALERRHVDAGGARPLRIAQIDALLPRRRRRHHRHRAAIRLRQQVRQLLHGEQDGLGRIRRDHHLGIARGEDKRLPAAGCGDGDSHQKCARYGRSHDNFHRSPSAQALDRSALPPERLFKMRNIISCATIKSEKESSPPKFPEAHARAASFCYNVSP